jgi:hypothetical protein
MKKVFIILFFVTGVLGANAQTKTTKDILLDTICTCFNNKKSGLEKMTQKQMEAAITQCMMSDGLELMMKYAEESGVEMTDQKGMQKIGITIGTELVKKCPGFMEMAMGAAQSEGSKTEVLVSPPKREKQYNEEDMMEGTVTAVNTSVFPATLQLKLKNGTVKKLYIVSEYQTSDEKYLNPLLLKGKKVSAGATPNTIFIPAKKKFEQIDVVEIIVVQ